MPAKLFSTKQGLAYVRYKSNPEKRHVSYVNPALDAMRLARHKLSKTSWKAYRHEGDMRGSNV